MGRSNWRRAIRFKPIRAWHRWQKAGLTTLVVILVSIFFAPLPSPLFNNPHATTLRSSNGILLSAAIAADQQWRFPASDSIPFRFATAIRLYEDEYFYYHPGVNLFSILRAIKQNFLAGKVVSGGSTISMQTVRMAFKNQPRTYPQKFIEVLATLKLEILYSKHDILKIYSDNAPFGGNIVGLNAASWRYFGLPPEKLSWAEVAALAVLPNSPSAIYPGKNSADFLTKRNFLLDKLNQKGFLNTDDLFLAKEESLPATFIPLPNHAYHLLHRSMQEGHTGNNITSTLDAQLQKKVAAKVNRHSAGWAGNQVFNAAAIVVEVSTGNILAYVGNSQSSGKNGQYVDVITAKRSPGSLLKPILYAAAIDAGLLLPRQLLPDIPIFYKGFAPQNFDRKYRGVVHADKALISSLNVPFVHLLINYGYEKFHYKLQQLGMPSLDRPAGHYGLSLILGGAETTLDELTALYAGMARAYLNYPTRPYKAGYSSNDYHANRYFIGDKQSTPTLQATGYLRSSAIGFTLQAMQQLNRPDQEAGWENFGSSKAIAWKTGTSYGLRDGWAIGLSGKYVVGVWLGNADGEGRPGLTGIQAAAPLLFKIFELLPDDNIFNQTYGTPINICQQSGMRAGKNCPQVGRLNLPEYLENTQICTFHKLIHLNETKTRQVNANCYEINKIQTVPWFILPPVESWYYKKYHPEYKKLPAFVAGCNASDSDKLFGLIYPRQLARIHIPIEQDGQPGKVVFEAAHEDKYAVLYWHLDDQFMGMTAGTHQMGVQTGLGKHVLIIVDSNGNEVRQEFVVTN